jgi:acetylglutamate kinase
LWAAGPASNSKAVEVTNIKTGETVEYVSQSAVAREFGVNRVIITNCIKNPKLLKQMYTIKRKSADD